jgi:hypothetical protein
MMGRWFGVTVTRRYQRDPSPIYPVSHSVHVDRDFAISSLRFFLVFCDVAVRGTHQQAGALSRLGSPGYLESGPLTCWVGSWVSSEGWSL